MRSNNDDAPGKVIHLQRDKTCAGACNAQLYAHMLARPPHQLRTKPCPMRSPCRSTNSLPTVQVNEFFCQRWWVKS